MPLYPLAPVLGLAALVYVLYANWMDPAVGRPSLIATLLITLAAIAYYLALRRRRGGAWAMTGPLTEDEG
jgi:L-asparagine transporter-like permease